MEATVSQIGPAADHGKRTARRRLVAVRNRLTADDVREAAGALALGRTWSAVGFDPDGAQALGLPAGRADLLLLVLVAVAAVSAIPAVGALLVTAIYVLPAAAARMLTGSIRGLVACALGVALAEGVSGLYLAYWLDVPVGPPVAVLGALVCLTLAAVTGRSAT